MLPALAAECHHHFQRHASNNHRKPCVRNPDDIVMPIEEARKHMMERPGIGARHGAAEIWRKLVRQLKSAVKDFSEMPAHGKSDMNQTEGAVFEQAATI